MIENLVKTLIRIYMQYEFEKMERKSKRNNTNTTILPKYVTKRRIQIYNNGKIVFDSIDVEEIPESIQYAIKSYGIPKNIQQNRNSKTPLVYRINTTLSSMFPSEAAERDCVQNINKIVS